jgi:hypothetical protein
MPPPARVCQACKACKVKCLDFSPGSSACERCTRLGLICEPAPQIPRKMPVAGKFARDGTALTTAPSSLTVADQIPIPLPAPLAEPSNSGSKELAIVSTDASDNILRATQSTQSLAKMEFALRHMAAIAKSRNAYTLMDKVVKKCRELNIKLESVLEPKWETSGPNGDGDDDPTASIHPFEMLKLVSRTQGYSLLRTISPNGRNAFFSNPAFEHDVISVDACTRNYERNERDTPSLFIHEDDLAVMRELMGMVWGRAVQDAGHVVTQESPNRVRVWLRKMNNYVTCDARFSVLCRQESGWVSGLMELSPTGGAPIKDGSSQDGSSRGEGPEAGLTSPLGLGVSNHSSPSGSRGGSSVGEKRLFDEIVAQVMDGSFIDDADAPSLDGLIQAWSQDELLEAMEPAMQGAAETGEQRATQPEAARSALADVAMHDGETSTWTSTM